MQLSFEWWNLIFEDFLVHERGQYKGESCTSKGSGEVDEEAEFGDNHG